MNKEDKILLEYFKSIYELNINNNIIKNRKNFNIILDENHLPIKLINIFYKNLPQNIYLTLINNALIYSLANNKINFIEKYKLNKHTIKNFDSLDDSLKKDILFYGINCVIDISSEEISKEDIYFITNKYKDLFNYIEENKVSIKFINEYYREIILLIINRYSNSESESIIKDIFTTNLFDEDIVECSQGFINTEELKYFKNYLFRLLIEDVYIFLKCFDYDINENMLKEILLSNNLDTIFEPGLFLKVFAPLKNDLLLYIYNCLKNNKFQINNDILLMEGLFRTFTLSLKLNFTNKDSINCLEQNEEKSNLKKINPCYKLDKIVFKKEV